MVILLIAQKELRELIRDKRLKWTVATLLVLLVASFVAGWQHYGNVNTLRAEAEMNQREQWVSKSMASAHVAAHAGISVFRPYTSLTAIEKGLDSHVGSSMFLEAHRRADFKFAVAEDRANTGGRFAEMTVALVLQVLVPLLIILLTYPLFAQERESGTARQLLSVGIQKRDLIFGKSIGSAAPLAAVLVPLTLAGICALFLLSESRSLELPRLFLMLATYLVYFSIFFCLGIIVSARVKTAQRALVLLLGFWFFVCLIAPPIAVEMGEYIYPSPTEKELAADAFVEGGDDAVTRHQTRLEKVEKELTSKYGVDSVKELPVDPYAVLLAEYEA